VRKIEEEQEDLVFVIIMWHQFMFLCFQCKADISTSIIYSLSLALSVREPKMHLSLCECTCNSIYSYVYAHGCV